MTQIRYAYVALDTQGRSQKGFLMAQNSGHAFEYLSQKGWYVITLKCQKNIFKNFFKARFCIQELYALVTQMHTLISAHVPLIETLATLKEIYATTEIGEVLGIIEQSVLKGESLSKACQAHPKFFDPLTLSMLTQGEAHNQLSDALKNLQTYLGQKIELQAQLKKAFAYPIFLIILFISLIAFLSTFLLPPMASFLTQNNTQGDTTFFWLNASLWIENYGVWVLIGLFFIIIAIAITVYLSPFVRTQVSKIFLQMPFVGSIALYQNLRLYFQGLALVSRSGQDLPKALNQAPHMVRSFYLHSCLNNLAPQMKQGQSIYNIFSPLHFIPPVVLRMIKVGEQSNQLSSSFKHIEDYLNNQLEIKIQSMGRILEPLLLLMMGGILMVIILSIFLPLYSNLGEL